MGRIFGISDLPVSTIMTPFKPIEVVKSKSIKDLATKFDDVGRVDAYVKTRKNPNYSGVKNIFRKILKG